MEPVTIVVLTNAALGIARSLVHTVKELYELAEAYETAALGIRTVATQCNSFRVAIQRIHSWLTTQDETSRNNLDEDFWGAIADNLETGQLVLNDLEKRIAGLKKSPAKFWTRTKYLWNSVIISELQTQIQGLMSAVSILIQVIDIPTTGGKRSQSLAQRSRLSNITKTVRLTVDQKRERIQKSQEQNLLDEIDVESTTDALEDPVVPSQPVPRSETIRQPLSRTSLPIQIESTGDRIEQQTDVRDIIESAPPPYDDDRNGLTKIKSKSILPFFGTRNPPEESSSEKDNSFRVLDRSDVKDTRPKRSLWSLDFKRRISTPKADMTVRSLSDPPEDSSNDTTQSSKRSQILNPFEDGNAALQHTPAPIDPSSQDAEYFGLQEAMSGMSMPTVTTTLPSDLISHQSKGREAKTNALLDPTDLNSQILLVIAPSIEPDTSLQHPPSFTSMIYPPTPQTTQPNSAPSFYPPPLESNELDHRTISPPPKSYAPAPSDPQAFERIRPSHRIREARQRSRSREPSRDPNPAQRQQFPYTESDRPTTALPPTSQTWRTNALSPSLSTITSSTSLSTSTTLRLKITYSPSLYTSRITHSAATALHLLDHALTNTIDNVPIATLSLLYVVSDGDSQSVMSDEVELEVMHEGERAGMEIVFGAGQVHVADVMEGAGSCGWSERGVPRALRSLEGLRLFRRFELVRW